MAVKDLALLKLVGSVVKRAKDKIVGVSAKNIEESEDNSPNESIKDTFKAVVGKSKEPISTEGKSIDTKVKDSSKEESTQAQATKKVYDSKTDKAKTVESTKKSTKKVDKTKAKKVATKTVKDSTKTAVKKEPTETKKAKLTATKKPKVEISKTTTTKSAKAVTKVEKVTKTEEAKVTKKKSSKVEKPKAKKSPAKKVEEKVLTTEAKKQRVKKNPTKAVAGTKREEKIKLYTADITKHIGSVDDAFLAIVVKNLGPSIYRKDAELVSCSDPKELETVKRNFLIKKLGFDKSENDMLDGEIQKVCETLKGVRTKYRATFYYMLAKNLKKESALS